MAFSVRVLADSVNPCGDRLTTVEATYPRCIHSEIMTHREFSRNAASSRAIPAAKLIQRVVDDPFVPIWWGKNEPGMQARAELSPEDIEHARGIWLKARDHAVGYAELLTKYGLHKQVVNRIIEPWMWITTLISTTAWDNFFGLRDHPDAEPHFQKLARMIRESVEESTPRKLRVGEWHLPLIYPEDYDLAKAIAQEIPSTIPARRNVDVAINRDHVLVKVSVGRCARVSYLTHDGDRDLREDIKLHDRLIVSRPLHASPAEHVAYALGESNRVGNFTGWMQYRKTLAHEYIGRPLP